MEFRRATKDHYERETEEAERLVRPAPKVKPKRTDLRREETQADRDPDVEGDRDLKADPDLSMNYKSVGGSTGARVLSRFLVADLDRSAEGRADLIRVRKKDTGTITHVTKERMEAEPGAYEVADEADEKAAPGDDAAAKPDAAPAATKPEEAKPEPAKAEAKPEEAKPAEPAKPEGSGDPVEDLRQGLESNKGFADHVTKMMSPEGEFSVFPDSFGLQGLKGLPPQFAPFKTLGDLRSALKTIEETKGKSKHHPKSAPTAPAGTPPTTPPAGGPEAPGAAAAPSAPGAEAKPESKIHHKLHPEDQKVFETWLKDKGPDDPKFKEWASDQPGVREKDGVVKFRDPKRKLMVPFNELSEDAQVDWKQKFDAESTIKATVDGLKDGIKKNPKLADVLRDLSNPESRLRQTLGDAKGSLDKDPRKSIPSLKGIDLPDSVNSVQDLIDATSKIFPAAPPPPERREPTESERAEALRLIHTKFPIEVGDLLEAQNLHPDDVTELLSSYHLAKDANPKNIADAVDMVQGGQYTVDPSKVTTPPRFGKDEAGQEVPYHELSPELQAVAMQKHRMRTVAINLAARESVVEKLKKKSDLPDELLGAVADFTLDWKSDESPEQRKGRAQHAAQDLFYKTLKSGYAFADTSDSSRFESQRDEAIKQHRQEAEVDGGEYDESTDTSLPRMPLPERQVTKRQVSKLLDALDHDPGAQQMAVGYLQAADYLNAREKFLDADSSDAISEHQSPAKIWRKMQNAMDFFKEQSEKYPDDLQAVIDPASDFRHRVLDKMNTLAPEKAPMLRAWNEDYEDEQFEQKSKAWDKKYDKPGKTPYRDHADAPPPRPKPPADYETRHGDRKNRKSEGQRLLEEHRRNNGVGDEDQEEPEALAKTAASVLARFRKYSSCSPLVTMASTTKTAVYWGVEPTQVEAYPKWTQIHQRDLNDSDYDGLVKAAREWMRAPVLSSNVEGIVKDTQLRAALDLAIRDHDGGRYSVGLQPPVYNKLLARLAGESQSDTLLTVRAAIHNACGCSGPQSDSDSLYAPTGEVPPMKASAQIRSFAARIASGNAQLAYDLLDLATKVAQDEQQGEQAAQDQKEAGKIPPQFLEHMKKKEDGGDDDKKDDQGQGQKQAAYAALKSAVIKMAHANPHLRDAYLPLLQTIKSIG
jgi:hypothetical protein